MRLLIVTDAWLPQVNGVVTSLRALVAELEGQGHAVGLITPQDFRHRPCPSYPEIPLAWDVWKVGEKIRAFAPDCIHLATEGPLGWAARRWLVRRGLRFSSAIHTRFPEYVNTRWPWLPLAWGYAFLRRFHRPSAAVLVSSERMRATFAAQGFARLALWRKGVDIHRFQPGAGTPPDEPVFCMSAAWRGKRTSKRSSASTCRGASASWAMARSTPSCRRLIHRWNSSAIATAMHWPRSIALPACWSFLR